MTGTRRTPPVRLVLAAVLVAGLVAALTALPSLTALPGPAASAAAEGAESTATTQADPGTAPEADPGANPGPCAQVPRAAFADVPDASTAAPGVDCLVWHGIARGVTHDRFAPGAPVRRDQFATLLAGTLTAIGVALPTVREPRFDDVAGVHANAVEQLALAGVIEGRTATQFAPLAPIRRDQLAALLARTSTRLLGAVGADPGASDPTDLEEAADEQAADGAATDQDAANVVPDGHPLLFRDLDGNVHAAAIDTAVALGLLEGTDATTFAPAQAATRGQVSLVLTRLLGLLLIDPEGGARDGFGLDDPSPLRTGPLPASLEALARRFTWQPDCPVGLDRLRLVEVVHTDLDGRERWGQLVVHRDVADDVGAAFVTLRERGFPIARMEPIEHFRGDDDASMAANNTSAFNCRRVTGGTRFSEHAYGWAVDLNPVQNPYVRGGTVLPPAGRDFVDRNRIQPGMLTRPGAVEVFDALGWGWGGDWRSLKDYQHVSLTGR
ncbi:MAG: hypothetical protein EA388_00280 [Nitriliruptor sp.]|nr:MAG: hypothetical protein EA388_00280 [Nitriliruptor sp.]